MKYKILTALILLPAVGLCTQEAEKTEHTVSKPSFLTLPSLSIGDLAADGVLEARNILAAGAVDISNGLATGSLAVASLPIAYGVTKACVTLPVSVYNGVSFAMQNMQNNLAEKSVLETFFSFPVEAGRFIVNAVSKTVQDYRATNRELIKNFPLYFSSYWAYGLLQDRLKNKPYDGRKLLCIALGLVGQSAITSGQVASDAQIEKKSDRTKFKKTTKKSWAFSKPTITYEEEVCGGDTGSAIESYEQL